MQVRAPHEDDLEELRALIDAQEVFLDPHHKPASIAWPAELLRGHHGTPINQIWLSQSGSPDAWASLHHDPFRGRVEVELFRVPGFAGIREVWQWCRDIAEEVHPSVPLWPTINHADEEMATVLAETGFELLRKYHILTRTLHEDDYPPLHSALSIEPMVGGRDFRLWHETHTEAFADHFAFVPKPYEDWIKSFEEYEAADPEGRFLLRESGEAAGYVVCTNDNAHDNGGFIQLLGVRPGFRGKCYGNLLLKWAFAYCVSRGFTDVDLTVDTGNSSGALALYHRNNFRRLSEYHLYQRAGTPAAIP